MSGDLQILDHRGTPLKQSTAYHGAGRTAKELRDWNPMLASADADLLSELPNLVARTRDLGRNNGVAAGGIQTLVDNVIGTGLRMQAKPDYRTLGWSKEEADAWAEQVEREWRTFAETTECDAGGELDFAELQQLAFQSRLESAEALGVARWWPNDRNRRWATAIQMVDPDRLSNPQNMMDTATLRRGVELDRRGRRVAYHIRRTHPMDLPFRVGKARWDRVPARMRRGRRLVIHAFERRRVGQHRGIPILSPVLAEFRMVDRYHRTELQSAVVNSLIAAFIQTTSSADQLAEAFGMNFEEYANARKQWEGQLEGGAVFQLPPGDTMTAFKPERPNSAFDSFVKSTLRHIATAMNMPYELLLKDFSGTNYSSARAALLEAWRHFNGRRRFMATKWCQPIYELWLEEAVQRGIIDAPGFYENWHAYTRARWIGPGRGWVDPVKEAQAAVLRMEAGISTLEDECAEQGKDWEEVLEQQARERNLRSELMSEDERNRLRAETYGIGVRAALITPQPEDEEHFRQESDLEPMSRETREAWREGGTRRPVTLQPPREEEDEQPQQSGGPSGRSQRLDALMNVKPPSDEGSDEEKT
ncbi:phage portal protein [Sediminicurvatus halobius]|nr:phage portal protein [Spiribacter halobius]UEX76801.1 phage portal protein [Spiribacter halobius]